MIARSFTIRWITGKQIGKGSVFASRSDDLNVAVGFNPRKDENNCPRRVATNESGVTIYSNVADATTILLPDVPWVETHGYNHVTAMRSRTKPNVGM